MDRVYGFVILGIGIGILWEGRSLSIGSLRNPGSGMFPALIAVAMVILSSMLILFPQKKDGDRPLVSAKSLLRLSAVFLAMMLYALFLESLGFLIVSLLLTTLLFIAFGSQSYWKAIFRAIVFTALAYTVFEVLFKSNLPRGLLGF